MSRKTTEFQFDRSCHVLYSKAGADDRLCEGLVSETTPSAAVQRTERSFRQQLFLASCQVRRRLDENADHEDQLLKEAF